MSDCELLTTCIFFNNKMVNMPSTAEIFKLKYCEGNNGDCARYRVYMAMGRNHVPSGLFPNQVEIADKIMASP